MTFLNLLSVVSKVSNLPHCKNFNYFSACNDDYNFLCAFSL
jgi:hypothetical protein